MTKFHVQLALATLLLLILEVTTGIIQVITTDVDAAGCITFIATTYYFVLVAFMWMGAEGVLLCQKVFCVFKKTTTLYLFIVSFVCWSKCLVKQILYYSASINSTVWCDGSRTLVLDGLLKHLTNQITCLAVIQATSKFNLQWPNTQNIIFVASCSVTELFICIKKSCL